MRMVLAVDALLLLLLLLMAIMKIIGMIMMMVAVHQDLYVYMWAKISWEECLVEGARTASISVSTTC